MPRYGVFVIAHSKYEIQNFRVYWLNTSSATTSSNATCLHLKMCLQHNMTCLEKSDVNCSLLTKSIQSNLDESLPVALLLPMTAVLANTRHCCKQATIDTKAEEHQDSNLRWRLSSITMMKRFHTHGNYNSNLQLVLFFLAF